MARSHKSKQICFVAWVERSDTQGIDLPGVATLDPGYQSASQPSTWLHCLLSNP